MPMAARCSSTKSAICRWNCRAICCGFCRRARSRGSAVAKRSAVDVRIVAATNVRLRQAIAENRFREDLFYRLNVLALEIPPLRQRPADIAFWRNHFLQQAAREFGREVTTFEPAAMLVLQSYHWPGNVRELMSTVRRAVVIGGSNFVAAADLTGLEGDAAACRCRRPGRDYRGCRCHLASATRIGRGTRSFAERAGRYAGEYCSDRSRTRGFPRHAVSHDAAPRRSCPRAASMRRRERLRANCRLMPIRTRRRRDR